jgi:hypothetical protein
VELIQLAGLNQRVKTQLRTNTLHIDEKSNEKRTIRTLD